MGYIVKPAASIIDGQYNPSIIVVAGLEQANPIAAEFNYQIFNNTINIAGWITYSFEEFTSVGRFKINLPNSILGTIEARCRGTWSGLNYTTTLNRVIIEELTTDLNYPILFRIQTSNSFESGNIAFNLIYSFG
jgi:hypothetical protein